MSLEDFMNAFVNTPLVEKVDSEYLEIEKQYKEKFGHIVPREMLPTTISAAQIKEAMQKSLASNKDNVLEQLGVKINPEYLY